MVMFGRKRQPIGTIPERVSRGVAVLDEKKPGWWRDVSLHQLNIARPGDCALGQTYGHYEDGRRVLGMSHRDAMDHGFQAKSYRTELDEFDLLTAEWRRQIETRLDAERERWARAEREQWGREVRVAARWWG